MKNPNLETSIQTSSEHNVSLLEAVESSDYEELLFLLKNGADANEKNNQGESGLHIATDRGNRALVKLLLEHGADGNSLTKDNETSLHMACYRGDSWLSALLLSYGADPNVQNKYMSRSPLHYASIAGSIDCIHLLICNGGNPHLPDCKGSTPLSLLDPFLRQKFEEGSRLDSCLKVITEESSSAESEDSPLNKRCVFLVSFLNSLNLEAYLDSLVKAGFDDLHSMIEQMNSPLPITSDVLQKCGIIKPGHQKRLLKKLRLESDTKPRYDDSHTCYTFNNSENGLNEVLAKCQMEKWIERFVETGYEQITFLREMNSNELIEALKVDVGVTCEKERSAIVEALTRGNSKKAIGCRNGCEVCLLL